MMEKNPETVDELLDGIEPMKCISEDYDSAIPDATSEKKNATAETSPLSQEDSIEEILATETMAIMEETDEETLEGNFVGNKPATRETLTYLSHAQQNLKAKRYAEALFACQQAIDSSPQYAEAYFLQADVYQGRFYGMENLGNSMDLDRADEAFARGAKLIPKHASDRYFQYARRYLLYKDHNHAYDHALDACKNAIAYDPKNAKAYFLWAVIHEERFRDDFWGGNEEDLTKAINYYSKAIELNPQKALYYEKRGQLYLHAGCTEVAREDFAKAKKAPIQGEEENELPIKIERDTKGESLGCSVGCIAIIIAFAVIIAIIKALFF